MTADFFPRVDPDRHRVLSGHSRVRVLEVLRAEQAALSVGDIAVQVGLHPNTVRLHLDQLVEAGLANREQESRDRPGRPRLVYAALPATDVPGSGARREDGEDEKTRYKVLAGVLVSHLEETAADPAAEATAAGRAWGQSLGQQPAAATATVEQATSDLAELLDDLGFAPRTTEPGHTMELHRCPFGQVADHHSPVVCGIHLGLMQGALTSREAPMQVSALEPFVTPQICLALFATKATDPTHGDPQHAATTTRLEGEEP